MFTRVVILVAKWTDNIEVNGKKYNHPLFQTACMFLGELICLFVFFIIYWIRKGLWKSRNEKSDEKEPKIPKFNPLIFALPALCDVTATFLGYIGLNLTTVSSYQMLRGAVIIFTGLLSMIFLRMRLEGYRWLGMLLVIVSLIIIGLTDIFLDDDKTYSTNQMIIGILFILLSEFIAAVQYVIEQKFLTEYDVPPLLAVGLEGLFGFIITSGLMVPAYFVHVPSTFSTNPYYRLEDAISAFKEIPQNLTLVGAIVTFMVFLAIFNFSGATISKSLSSTTRMVIDSFRTLSIWVFSIWLFGETFIALQIIGFVLLILGTFVYNDVFFGPYFRRKIMSKNCEYSVFCIKFWGFDDEETIKNCA